jgi:hypothetical protein
VATVNASGKITGTGGLVMGPEMSSQVPGVHLVEFVASGSVSPLVVAAGNGTIQVYKDSGPTKAVSFGMGISGSAITDDLIFARWDGASWAEMGRFANSTSNLTVTGTITGSNLSGTNTGNQTITLTSDVTGTGTGSFATTIAAGAVTTAKMANLASVSLLGNPTGGATAPSAITLAGGLGFSGSTLTAAGALTPTSVASSGAISGTSITGTTTILSSGATSGIGYATGAGGTVTQITSRVTGVTLNKACGAITLVSAAGSATWSSFTVTDSAVAATDVIIANQKSGTDIYMLTIHAIAAGSFVLSSATTGGTTTETPVIQFCVVKGVNA